MDEPVVVYVPFLTLFMLCLILITYINFKTFEEYLQELEYAQIDRQSERQTNRMHKHLASLLESTKKCMKNPEMKTRSQEIFTF